MLTHNKTSKPDDNFYDKNLSDNNIDDFVVESLLTEEIFEFQRKLIKRNNYK